MKTNLTVFLFPLLILTISTLLYANPFSCDNSTATKNSKEKNLEDLSYKGYAKMRNQEFALIQIGKKQYTLRAGDTVRGVKLIKISARYLEYKKKDKVFKVSIDKNN